MAKVQILRAARLQVRVALVERGRGAAQREHAAVQRHLIQARSPDRARGAKAQGTVGAGLQLAGQRWQPVAVAALRADRAPDGSAQLLAAASEAGLLQAYTAGQTPALAAPLRLGEAGAHLLIHAVSAAVLRGGVHHAARLAGRRIPAGVCQVRVDGQHGRVATQGAGGIAQHIGQRIGQPAPGRALERGLHVRAHLSQAPGQSQPPAVFVHVAT